MGTKICPHCGVELDENATRCYNCQQWLNEAQNVTDNTKPQDFLSTLLFAWFLGGFGIHRFWTGYYAIGVAQLLTLGGCGIWALVDIISICFYKYKDAHGRELRDYNRSVGIVMFVLVLIPIVFILFLFTLICALVIAKAAS